ncbi:CopD family protein [Mycetohabitans sp. B5]|uniref:Putative copper resistance protein D n=1 Tax=Mycetohabitans endofungorum TaxID=417203 RepID=A0A2P5K922_9BURK|nr:MULTISPECIES: CopD family protein [Mycetohabitans]MCG1054232.1 CopD family protein [Mycetohabitans sp. B5]PPB83211.1 putative copper resistance protein D [Mycetohabitans endofungorum]
MTSSLSIMQMALAAIQDVLFAIAAGSILCGATLATVFASSRDAARLRLRGSIKQAMPGIRLPTIQWFSLCALAIAQVVYLWLQAATMSGSTLSAALGIMLRQSHYGAAWLTGTAGIAVALAASRVHLRGGQARGGPPLGPGSAPPRWPMRITVLGLALYAASKAAASHAAGAGDFSLTQAVYCVHVGASAAWAGGVSIAAFVLPTFTLHTRADGGRHLAFCERLSRASAVALTLVALTGLYNVVWICANAPAPLAGTYYGRWLGAKLVIVAAVVLLRTLNRAVWLPRLRDAQHAHGGESNRLSPRYSVTAAHLGRTLLAESALLAAALIAAATLSHLPPA